MQTTIDIPLVLYQQLMDDAQQCGESFSATVVKALTRGMDLLEASNPVQLDSLTPVMFDSGRPVTSEEVADLIDEDD